MEEKIKTLKERLRKIETRDLLGMIGNRFITFVSNDEDFAEQSNIFNKTKLVSPQKQYTYLAGLLMSTEDKSEGSIIEDIGTYDDLENELQEITLEYTKNFIDIDISLDGVDTVKRNLVSMEAFNSYFDMGILRYPEQTIDLIRTLYGSFDVELQELTGLTIEDYISFYQLVFNAFSNSIDAPKNSIDNLKKFLESLNPDTENIEQEYKKMLEFGQGQVAIDLQNSLDSLSTIKASEIIDVFGEEKGNILINIFSLYRKERDFKFYNGQNPFAKHPLCWVDEGETLFIVHPQFVLNAIYNYITDILEEPKNTFSDKYKKLKAETVENEFLRYLKCIFGDKAKYHISVCEERGTKEHDILIEFNNYIIVAEVKASKVREPFFNPEKAYTRIKDHFNSDTGIGGAYKQAIILKKFIESNDQVTLYENKTSRFVIENVPRKVVLPIVLTLNQFGSLAVNTTMLLEKEEQQPYPWVCNLHDFENIIKILQYLKKSPQDFVDYIIWRMENHEKIVSSDELDVIEGYFLDTGIRKNIKSSVIFFPPNGASLIDKIYFEKEGVQYSHPLMKKHKSIGRNNPCPCGSGKKFKKCCIGKGLYD
ncbi:YecA family protein [Clostridium perfringens]|uniref:YecA family protein n=1 Tax=Clostridium perfringens TaxID=1502 RepID=UPI0024480FE8|nr:SEC-C metal-binding domain-containing protein [Clostridium perfringens]MDH2339505.1 SEC-C metal-binding domain-containing protein [Clostridium perfringens]